MLEQVEYISKDIYQKISEVEEGSDAHKFLLVKKKILDDSLQTIINEAQINKYEYELYSLFEKCEGLRYKISLKGRRPTDDDEDMKAAIAASMANLKKGGRKTRNSSGKHQRRRQSFKARQSHH
jgi:hypothetical protein